MRIAHVLTYVSADGAYGGPLAVMVAQCTELAARGHDVEVFAGWDGVAVLAIPGVTVHLFPTSRVAPGGFSGLISPRLVRELRRRASSFDAIHVHLSRDLVTAPAALAVLRAGGRPRVYAQPHGMIKPDQRVRARVFDIAIRSILRRCTSVFALTLADAARIGAVANGRASIVELPNGVAAQAQRHHASVGVQEIVFLARLQPRKRVLLFAEAAALLIADGVEARFRVVGPDEGDLAALRRFIESRGLGTAVVYEGAIPPGTAPERLLSADVYVLPSLDEPFPMTVLEAMSVAVPCVISSTCLIATRLQEYDAAVLFSGGARELADAIGGLIRDAGRRRELGDRALATASRYFSVEHVVESLEHFYSTDRSALLSDPRQLAQIGGGER